jgi:indolepyruvate ferredoxin oxidoreductase beta subunit
MKSILICGVGGQGVLTASNLLSDVLMKSGFSVKKSEVHGMSQRGGDVVSTIKYGKEVYSPLPMLSGVDYILSFELLEGLRNLKFLSSSGIIMVNNFIWEPLPVAAGLDEYPLNVREKLKENASRVEIIPASEIAEGLGNIKATNIVLMGLLAKNMKNKKELWVETIREKIPPKFIDLNLSAFESGYNFN